MLIENDRQFILKKLFTGYIDQDCISFTRESCGEASCAIFSNNTYIISVALFLIRKELTIPIALQSLLNPSHRVKCLTFISFLTALLCVNPHNKHLADPILVSSY